MKKLINDTYYACPAPDEETDKSYKVWNGKSFSYLAKSQMEDVQIGNSDMVFKSNSWFAAKHPWLRTTVA